MIAFIEERAISALDGVDGSRSWDRDVAHWVLSQTPPRAPSMDEITPIGIDLAKSVFQLHGVREDGAVALRRKLRRGQVLSFFEGLPPCLIGMEGCQWLRHRFEQPLATRAPVLRAYAAPLARRSLELGA